MLSLSLKNEMSFRRGIRASLSSSSERLFTGFVNIDFKTLSLLLLSDGFYNAGRLGELNLFSMLLFSGGVEATAGFFIYSSSIWSGCCYFSFGLFKLYIIYKFTMAISYNLSSLNLEWTFPY